MNDMLLHWTAAIDEAGNNFRVWYSLVSIPSDIANISIQIMESYIVNVFIDILNMPLKDLIGTNDPMSMSLKTIIFVLIYRHFHTHEFAIYSANSL